MLLKTPITARAYSDLAAQQAVWCFCKAETIRPADKAAAQLVHTMQKAEVWLPGN